MIMNKLSFEQECEICSVIDEWYLKWKRKDLNSHIGVAKEELKRRICGKEILEADLPFDVFHKAEDDDIS